MPGDTLLGALLLAILTALAVRAEPPLFTDVGKGADFSYKVNPSLPLFHFHLGGDPEANLVTSIACAKGDEPVFQTLKDPGMTEPPRVGARYFLTGDMNFDGYQDIALLSYWGEHGNQTFRWWLYNSKTGRFDYCPSLSQLTNPVAHPKAGTLTSHFNGGQVGYTFTDGTYRWQEGALVPIRLVSQKVDRDGHYALNTVQERRNGKLTVMSRRRLKIPPL